ncbi:hypothetical protein DL766_005736 [Monosporascus sp. MC13-8B]|nr:hypothetical protein DL763_008017 [Monosporascus cannonballus]RYP28687.1 hypothetical protein DL766_005736 [Monosporascus sp. MC13-8B]
MAFCHYCDITALGCSGRDSVHTSLTTHRGHWQGLGSPTLSSKVVLNESILHLSAALLAEESPHRASIDESLQRGTLSRKAAEEAAIERARLVAQRAAEETATLVATRIANDLAPPEARKTAIEPARVQAVEVATRGAPIAAREAAAQPARDRATEVAKEVAAQIAANIANELSPLAAKEAAIQPATIIATKVASEIVLRKILVLDTKIELDNFVDNQMKWLKNVPQAEIPEMQATQVPRLALYDFLVLCDDSRSMRSDGGLAKSTQEATVGGLFDILKDLGSEGLFSIIPFEEEEHERIKDAAGVKRALHSIRYGTSAKALKPLEERIIRRLKKQAKKGALPPTVIVVMTDGDTGEVTDFGNAIGRFKRVLRQHGYGGPAALFLICRVGNDVKAAKTLEALNDNEAINDVVLYPKDQLDLKLKETNGDVNGYIGWVVRELLRAMKLQLIKP